jgi:hypothetical protein
LKNKGKKNQTNKTKQNKFTNYKLREASKVMNVIHHGNYKRRKEQQLDSFKKS